MTKEQMLLVLLMEECDELSQRASKAIRFGLDEIQKEQKLSNKERLVYEFNDLYTIMELLEENMLIDSGTEGFIDREAIDKKKQKIEKYLKYSQKLGQIIL